MRIRIAMAIDEIGKWYALGWSDFNNNQAMQECIDALDTDLNIEKFWIDVDIEPTKLKPIIAVEGLIKNGKLT